jgi:hypothetical protein
MAATHPIFEKCLPYIADPYWKAIFENATRGKFHKSAWFSERDNTLVFQRMVGTRSEKTHLGLDTLTPEEAVQQIIDAHRNILSCYSPNDIEHQQEEQSKIQDTYEKDHYAEWKNVLMRVKRQSLISNYLNTLPESAHMTSKQKRRILSNILLYISLGFIQNEHIRLEDEAIIEITNIKVTDDYSVSLTSIGTVKEPSASSSKKKSIQPCPLDKLYETYLKSL